MTTRIYYFTGTGNSLWAARFLEGALDDTTLTPIVRALADGDTRPDCDRVVIVCPVYMYRLPHIVVRFIDALRTTAPIVVVATMGGDPGSVFAFVQRKLASRGLTLAAGLTVAVQSNYVAFGGAPGDDELAAKLEAARLRMTEIAGIIDRGEAVIERTPSAWRAAIHPGLLYRLGYKFISQTDGDYRVDDGCDGCGICALVCPVDNITLVEERPTWHKRCEQCMACMQWCPQEVIQVKDKTRGERRYHHPEVRSKDIVAQKKRPKQQPKVASD